MSTRRDFLKQAAAVTATAVVGNSFLSQASAAPKKKVIGANDKINIGVIGVNSRGKALAGYFAKMPGCEVGFLSFGHSTWFETVSKQSERLCMSFPFP